MVLIFNFWRSAGSEWRVTECRDGELGKWPKSILPHITLKSIIPHITDRQPRIRRHTAAMLNAAHQHLEQFTWTVQSSPILSSIPAAAANSGNCTSMQCNGVQTGGLPVQRVTRGWCTVVPYCTLVQSQWCTVVPCVCTVVQSWWSGVKCTGPLISEKYCPQIVAALSPTTKQKSPSPPNHHHHHHHHHCQL